PSPTCASRRAATWWCGDVRLDRARGFVFDVDGTLVDREGHTAHVVPGALEVLERIRSSGRPFVLFTNGSHIAPAGFARGLRDVGLPVSDEQFLTPLCSVQAYLDRGLRNATVLPFVTEAARDYLLEAGLNLVDGEGDGAAADVVFVAHTDEIDFPQLERAARSVIAGARFLTGSYVA